MQPSSSASSSSSYAQQQQRGKTILKALLILSATCVFASLYSHIREPFSTRHGHAEGAYHPPTDLMNRVQFLFTCLLLLLIGMPIIR
jgi:ABC-type Fe3+ transport system permease subunit